MKKLTLILIVAVFSSCAINENGYSYLSKEEKAFFKPYDNVQNNTDAFIVQEITGSQCKELISENEYTLVVLWAPHCKGNVDYPLSNYEKLERSFEKHGLKIIVISGHYDIKNIQKEVKATNFNKPIYVLSNSVYGSKTGKAMDKFLFEISNQQIKRSSVLLFKSSQLIYSGFNISDDIISELL